MKRIATPFLFVMVASILVACMHGEEPQEAVQPLEGSPPPDARLSETPKPVAVTNVEDTPKNGEPAAEHPSCETTAEQVDRLVWWTRVQEVDPEWDEINQIAQNYTEATGTPVEVVPVPDADFRSRMSIAAPAGEGPDVFGPIAHDWISEFVLQQIGLPVPEDAIRERDDIIESAFAAATIEGELYGAPLFVESVALLYNREMVPEPPETWEELVQIATDLTEGDTYGFAFPLLEQYHEGPFFRGFGGYVFNYQDGEFDTEDIGLNNEGSVRAAQFLRDMYHNQEPPMPYVVIDRVNMHGVVEGMMEAGQVAMTINGPWREVPLQEAGIDYGVAKLPSLPNGEPMRPFLDVQVIGASAFSQNQGAALDLMNFITCTDSVVTYYRGAKNVPVRQSALKAPMIQENRNIAVWNEQAADGIPLPNVPPINDVWQPWADAMDAIVPANAPDEEIQQLLDNAVEQIRQEMEQTQQ